jgi:hypothetical protein
MSTRFRVSSFLLLGLILILLAACTALPPAMPDGAVASPAPAGDAAAETNGTAAGNMQQLLARQLGLPEADVRIVSVEPMEWPDACLGAGGPAESCALVVTPGYKLTFKVNGGTYVYHTDPSGYQFRLVAAPEPALGETILAWTGQAEDGSCRQAVFGTEGLAFGRCGGKLLGTSYVKQTRQAELVDFAARYASFDVPTPTGTIKFTADGPTAATPAEQRMLAEWAWLVQWEAQNGGPITWSEALAWQRKGGVAGFCDDLSIDVTGEATARSCASGQQVKLGRTHLSAAQLADLYRWIDTLQPFQTETVDPATADALTVRLAFNGTGAAQAADSDIRAISDFAAQVYRHIEAETQAATTPIACPAGTETLQALIDTAHGYCLAYPAEYKVEKPNPNSTLLVIGGLLDASNPRVEIRVEDAGAGGREAAISRMEADYSGFPFERSDAAVGGVPAVVLDGLPGQEITRRVLFVHEGRLYMLDFAPADPTADAFARMETLYGSVLDSFTLLPRDGLVIAGQSAASDCLAPTSKTQLLTDAARGFCLLYPADFSAVEPNPGEIVLYAGSLQDVSHPKLFIQVEDARGRTAEQVADEVVAEVISGMPGYAIDRSFGVTIGFEPAARLDGVPGQDLSRQVIAVHDGRVYKLVFVPADEAQGDVYREMEALYELALRSFRFLPQP